MTGGPRRRGLVGPAIVAALGVALLASLGAWQLRRAAWKQDLLSRMEARIAAPAVAPPAPSDWATLAPDGYEFRRVVARGVYDPTREALVFAGAQAFDKGPAQPGYFVLTPLRLADGAVALVNRGFAPIDLAEAGRIPPPPQGETTATGWMRPPERRNPFTPADEPGRRRFFARDPAAIATALGLGAVAPFTIDLEDGGAGWPRGGASAQRPPDNHLSYALTWFGLAGALAAFFIVWARRR